MLLKFELKFPGGLNPFWLVRSWLTVTAQTMFALARTVQDPVLPWTVIWGKERKQTWKPGTIQHKLLPDIKVTD